MPQFCMLFYAKYTILATQKGAVAQWPPLYAPASEDRTSRAKDRDTRGKIQGHRRKCSQKKSLQKFFSGVLKK